MVAHERVVRGEQLTEDPRATALPAVLDLPLRLEAWEPAYAVAEYEPDKLTTPAPRLPPLRRLQKPGAGKTGPLRGRGTLAIGPEGGCSQGHLGSVRLALEDLAGTWTSESNGRAEAVGVTGSAVDAVRALGAEPVEIVELEPETAIALMAWAAANGGAHGRRRGTAPGRFGAWSVLAAIAGVDDDWPSASARLAEAAISSRWYAWGAGEPATGWSLRVACEVSFGPADGTAFALSAIDAY